MESSPSPGGAVMVTAKVQKEQQLPGAQGPEEAQVKGTEPQVRPLFDLFLYINHNRQGTSDTFK